MKTANRGARWSDSHDEKKDGLLHRIEEKLDQLLGQREDEWQDGLRAPADYRSGSNGPGDLSPSYFGDTRAKAPGWDPSPFGPRFDRIDPGSIGTHGVDPVASCSGAPGPPLARRRSRWIEKAGPVGARRQPGCRR